VALVVAKRGMAVLPSWQGTGLATGLLREVESYLLKLACTGVISRHNQAHLTGDSVLRKEWVRSSGRGHRFLRHATLRIRQSIIDLY
jgi:GNAT superfamily N-acetyltransferase